MKNILIAIILLSGNLFAQEVKVTRDYASEAIIYDFIGGVNPSITRGIDISMVANTSLSQWVTILAADYTPEDDTFFERTTDYVIISNIWKSSEAKDRTLLDMLFYDLDPLIIKNMGEDNLLDCIKNSKEVGVSFLHVDDIFNSDEAVDIYLILLNQTTNENDN